MSHCSYKIIRTIIVHCLVVLVVGPWDFHQTNVIENINYSLVILVGLLIAN